jgi:hypothetical protein
MRARPSNKSHCECERSCSGRKVGGRDGKEGRRGGGKNSQTRTLNPTSLPTFSSLPFTPNTPLPHSHQLSPTGREGCVVKYWSNTKHITFTHSCRWRAGSTVGLDLKVRPCLCPCLCVFDWSNTGQTGQILVKWLIQVGSEGASVSVPVSVCL